VRNDPVSTCPAEKIVNGISIQSGCMDKACKNLQLYDVCVMKYAEESKNAKAFTMSHTDKCNKHKRENPLRDIRKAL
jgi:hypothetical protein